MNLLAVRLSILFIEDISQLTANLVGLRSQQGWHVTALTNERDNRDFLCADGDINDVVFANGMDTQTTIAR